MPHQKKRKRLLVRNMLLDVQGRSETPAILKRRPECIGSLRKRKWVEEIQL